MYLSQLILNPRSRQVLSELARPYEMHRTIMRAFPDNLNPNTERVLFRLDRLERRNRLQLLVQSRTEPNWDWLQETNYLLPERVDTPLPNPTTKDLSLSVHSGQVYNFRLLANPTKRLGKSAGNDKGKRVGLYQLEEQEEWLRRKGEQHGFLPLMSTPAEQRRLDDRRQKLKLFAVRFDGILQIVDGSAFAQALAQGIGSGKAFGFGLLSIAPANLE